MRTVLLILVLVIGQTGCARFQIPRYAASPENREVIKRSGIDDVRLGEFKGEHFSRDCRAVGDVYLSDDTTLGGYFRRALRDELSLADVLNENSGKHTLNGELTFAAFDSASGGIYSGVWTLRARLVSDNGRSVSADINHTFRTAFGAEPACRAVAEAFVDAMRVLIRNLLSSPGFAALLRTQ